MRSCNPHTARGEPWIGLHDELRSGSALRNTNPIAGCDTERFHGGR